MKKKVLLSSRHTSALGLMVEALEVVFEQACRVRDQIRLKYNSMDE